jgi:O-antigen/teichoic acid export membrane protein
MKIVHAAPVAERVAGWRASSSDPLYRTAYSLMANTMLTAVLGLVFWLAAARLFSSSVVGRDSALISAMMGISAICQLNLNNALTRFLPVTRRASARIVISAYAVSALVSLVGAVAFVVLAPRWSSQLRFLRDDHVLAAEFCVMLPAWAVFTLQDSALTALHRAPWVAIENTLFGIVKLAVLPVLIVFGVGHGLFVAWTGPVLFIIVAINVPLFRRLIPDHVRTPRETSGAAVRIGRPAVLRFLTLDYLAWALNNGLGYLLPLLVVALLGSRQNAYFYIAYTISATLNMLFLNAATSLTVEASAAEASLAELTRRLVARLLPPLLVGVVALVAAAPLVLLPFGAAYARAGVGILRLFAVASIFRAVVILYSAVARVRGRGGRILAANLSLVVLLVVSTIVLGRRYGLAGVGAGWLIAHALVAVAVLPSMRTLLRGAERPAFMAANPGG